MSCPDLALPHRARLFANKLLSRLGFELTRRPRGRGDGAELIPMQLGDFQLMIHANNSLWREYEKNPEYTAQLGRLAACVCEAHPDGYVLDVGANIGDTAAIVRTACPMEIICVEGDEKVHTVLLKNVAQMPNVTAHQCFLGEKTEILQVKTDKDGWDMTLIPVATTGVSSSEKAVPLLSLDDFVAKLQLAKPCRLLKLDIEGFDLRALRGASGLLSRDQPVVIFEFNHQNLAALKEDGLPIFPYLTSLGYQDACIFDGQGCLMQPCRISDITLLSDLDDYARSFDGLFYYDICVFPASESALAARFLSLERAHRKSVIESKRLHR